MVYLTFLMDICPLHQRTVIPLLTGIDIKIVDHILYGLHITVHDSFENHMITTMFADELLGIHVCILRFLGLLGGRARSGYADQTFGSCDFGG